jgi:hypothetical protein
MVYKYKLSVCLCIKNEAKHIIDFIEHYIIQGVEHFYIIDNNSDDNLKEILEKSYYNFLITLISNDICIDINNAYSSTNGLVAVYNNDIIYETIKKETEWGIVVDIDEFMYGKNGHNIKTFLETIDDSVGCVYVIWNIMTSSTIKNENSNSFHINSNIFKRLNYDSITNLSYNIKNANDFGKSIFRTSMINCIGLHKSHCTTGKIINNYGENKNSWYDNCNNIEYSENIFKNTNISLNHYVIRDYNDYVKKKTQFECNVEQRNALLNGIFELLELDDMYFVTDNEINENRKLRHLKC